MSQKPASSEKHETTDKVIALCLRRGLIFPTSDAYGSFAGFFDYGPYGVELRRNFEHFWWKFFVRDREDIVGLDGAIISHPKVWEASGHLSSFNDLLVECKKCHERFRADHLLESVLGVQVDGLNPEQIAHAMKEHKVVCPNDKGPLSEVKKFNLLFKTHIGSVEGEKEAAYLRGETAQSIFAAFRVVNNVARKHLPYGIAQIGRVFRNEISPRNFIFRAREFTIAELEFFLNPEKLDECPLLSKHETGLETLFLTGDAQEKKKHAAQKMTLAEALSKKLVGNKWHAYWLAQQFKFFTSLGVSREKLRFRQHMKDELSHYSSETWDIEYDFPFGWKELGGVANRGQYDLTQHSKASGTDLSVFDEESKKRVMPAVIEPTFGLDRAIFTILIDAFEEKKDEKGEVRMVLKLHPSIAPVSVAVFPLVKKDGLSDKAREVFDSLKNRFNAEYDESGSIGKRYARHDEIGTPLCVTVDYETKEGKTKGTVTIRDRDSGAQKRVKIEELARVVEERLNGAVFSKL